MLLFLILAPLLGAVLVLAGAPARATSLLAATLMLAGAFFVYFGYDPSTAGYQFLLSVPISSSWRFQFLLGADGLTLIMLLLTALVTFAAVWVTPKIEAGENAFYACLLFISAGAVGAFTSLDLFFFYAFHELALIPTFLLIGIWGSGNRQAAAWKITIYLALGSFILLLGLLLLYRSVPEAARTFDLRELQIAAGQIPGSAQNHIYLLLLIGFGVLISLFPFHSWAPEAYASAPAPAAMLHAGVLKKFGLYGLIRVALPLLPEGARHWNHLLIALLIGNIIYVGLVTIAQKRLDWILGYSSVMHMGYIFLGISTLGVLGTNGAALLMFAHGISIALLFAVAGEIRRRTGTLHLDELGGLARVMPYAGLVFGIGTFAAIGLPGFANFAAELLVFFGAWSQGAGVNGWLLFQVTTALALWGVVMSAVYMLRAYRATFMGPISKRWDALSDLPRNFRIPLGVMIAATLVVGFYPASLLHVLAPVLRNSVAAR